MMYKIFTYIGLTATILTMFIVDLSLYLSGIIFDLLNTADTFMVVAGVVAILLTVGVHVVLYIASKIVLAAAKNMDDNSFEEN